MRKLLCNKIASSYEVKEWLSSVINNMTPEEKNWHLNEDGLLIGLLIWDYKEI